MTNVGLTGTRRHLRISAPATLRIKLRWLDHFELVVPLDVSPAGAQVSLPDRLTVGKRLAARVAYAGGASVEITACVRHVLKDGPTFRTGLEFEVITEEQRWVLADAAGAPRESVGELWGRPAHATR